MDERGRLPDFVIIGAMKSATTSLYRWLGEQPEVFVPRAKETRYFSDLWDRGQDWYEDRFAEAIDGQLLGEASVSYTNPEFLPDAAERMSEVVPEARLIYAVRDPVQRLRSHYRFEVQRRRESRPLLEALREPHNLYLGRSMYFRCLVPYLERFPQERILVVRFEDLVRAPNPGWPAVLSFLSLPDRPLPETAFNVSAEKGQWTRAWVWAKDKRLISLRTVSRMPKPVRRLGRKVFARRGEAYDATLEASRVPIPEDLIAPVWDDVAKLEAWVGTPLWPGGGARIHSEAAP